MLWLWRAPGSETVHFQWDIALARRIMYDIGRRGSGLTGESAGGALWREEMSPVAGISQFCEREAMVGCLWAPLKDGGRRQGL